MNRRALVASVILGGLIATVNVATGAEGECGDRIVSEGGGWTRIVAPTFTRGPAAIASFAIDPLAPSKLVATNGRVVMRSTDGGCTWAQTFHLPEAPSDETPYASTNSVIARLIVAPTAPDRVFGLITRTASFELQNRKFDAAAHVIRSTDGGASWRPTDDAMLPGRAVDLISVDSSPSTIYLGTSIPNGSDTRQGVVYVSRDAGATWTATVSPTGDRDALPGDLTDVAVDPATAQSVWGSGPDGVWHSPNGGADWERISDIDGPALRVDVVHPSDGPARIWAMGPTSHRSDDGGASWREMPSVSSLRSIATASGPDHVFATSGFDSAGAAYGFDGTQWLTLREMPEPLGGAIADRLPSISFYAHSPFHIWRLTTGGRFTAGAGGDLPPSDSFKCAEIDTKNLGPVATPRPALLTPPHVAIKLRPGQEMRVNYSLDLGPRPSPVDVFFLMDATSSMHQAICDAKRSVAAVAGRLMGRGIDVHFGLASYRDYPVIPYGSPHYQDWPYRLHNRLGAFDWSMVEALDDLLANGGGNLPESQLPALYQAATGAGDPPWVPSGRGAGFDRNGIRVILNVTDQMFNDDPAYPGPSFDDTMKALTDRGIKQVGLGYRTNGGGLFGDLRKAALRTGALAPSPGVDCDGDGDIEVKAGQPLVCAAGHITGKAPVADAIVNMLLAIRDEAKLTIAVEDDSEDFVPEDGVDGAGLPDVVDLRNANLLDFGVLFRCLPEQVGTEDTVDIVAKVGSKVVATATAAVECAELPEGIPDVTDPPRPVGVAAAPVAPPPIPPIVNPGPAPHPAPGQAPQPQPQPNPQSNPQPQGQGQAQGVVVVQQQKQTQTALATAGQQVSAQEEYSMSARRTSDPIDDARWPVAIGGAVLGLAFGCLSRARRRSQLAHVRRAKR